MGTKNQTKTGILLMLACTVFTSVGQLFFKYSSYNFSFNLLHLVKNYNLIFGFLFYGVGSLILLIALKYGDLSQLYPFVALNFVWVTLLSVFILGESLNSFKINAIFFVVFGVILIGGSK